MQHVENKKQKQTWEKRNREEREKDEKRKRHERKSRYFRQHTGGSRGKKTENGEGEKKQ